MKIENRQTPNPWQDTGDDKMIEEGSQYAIPINITVADGWNHEPYEERSPEGIQQQARGSNYQQMATSYYRDDPSQLTWETFMDTVAFPEKSIPIAAKYLGPTVEYYTRDWTSDDVQEALMVACHDTVLCGDPNEEVEEDEDESEYDEY
jgi:hypothetical protein